MIPSMLEVFMFYSTFIYEWEKFWGKKTNVLCFIAVPFIVWLACTFSLETNVKVKMTDVAFSSNMNFHITSLQEMLLTACNAITIVFISLSFNEEYRSGSLRMAYVRPISIKQVYWAKTCSLIVVILFFLALQFLVSFLLGQFVLPHVNETALFFREGLYSGYDVIIFSIKYYGLAFLSLLVFGAVIESISLACKTITGTIGASLGFLFASGLFVVMLGEFAKGSSYEHTILSMSLLYTQAKGIAFFASGSSNVYLFTLFIQLLLFKAISYALFTTTDYFE
ncbi:ABC-2 family transporter protein [Brevibacillus laterosporus]|nr:ABC-2 family transporter protein [Brevibacillus laterosporus]